jgi:type II secretory pathway pseudopilin PulG
MEKIYQAGFALLELMLAAILTTLMAVWAAGVWQERVNDAMAQSHAVWMGAVKSAVRVMMEAHHHAIVLATQPGDLQAHGYADWTKPQLAELKANRLLSAGFPNGNKLGGGVIVRIVRHGGCPGTDCQVQGLVYSEQPFLKRPGGPVDEQMVAQWLLAARGWGGWVPVNNALHIRGASFDLPNPPYPGEPLPAGTVAMALTSDQLSDLDYLRVRDHRDPQFQGGASIEGDVQVGGSVQATGYLATAAVRNRSSYCTATGALARDTHGDLLTCRNGSWRSAGRSGGGYSVNSKRGCASSEGTSTVNPVHGQCSCPSGYVPVLLSESGALSAPEGRTRGYLCVD